jgi:hypothetical protein
MVGCFSQARIATDDFGYVVAITVRCSASRRYVVRPATTTSSRATGPFAHD